MSNSESSPNYVLDQDYHDKYKVKNEKLYNDGVEFGRKGQRVPEHQVNITTEDFVIWFAGYSNGLHEFYRNLQAERNKASQGPE